MPRRRRLHLQRASPQPSHHVHINPRPTRQGHLSSSQIGRTDRSSGNTLTGPGQPPVPGNHSRLTFLPTWGMSSLTKDSPVQYHPHCPCGSHSLLCPSPPKPPRTNSPGTHSGWLPSPRPLSFSTKFPGAAAPSTQAARQVWPDKPASVSQTQRPICLEMPTGPHSARSEALALPLLRDPKAEGRSPRRRTARPAGNTAMPVATPGALGLVPADWTQTAQEPHLRYVPQWPGEQTKQALGKTLVHPELHQGRILEQHPKPHQPGIKPAPNHLESHSESPLGFTRTTLHSPWDEPRTTVYCQIHPEHQLESYSERT